MLLLLAIAGCGAWCAHQHWMRLDQEESVWRRSFWPWLARGWAFPAAVWAAANFGLGSHFPPLVPAIANAQASGQPWAGRWFAASTAGAILVMTCWAAVTYVWMTGVMFRQARDKTEIAFNLAVFGSAAGLFGAALALANGPLYWPAALVVTLLPAVHLSRDLAEAPPARPVYDRAIGKLKLGKYQAAEWEVISQLEKREDDFQGWIMLAELYALQHRNIADAARVVLDICQNPRSQPAEIALACHKLADWQLEIGANPEGAKAALELLGRKLPDTHFAAMARQRARQLPQSAAELHASRKPKRVHLPALREDAASPEPSARSRSEAADEARRLAEKLSADPDDFRSREQFASVLAADLGKIDLGIEQLQLLIEVPDAPEEQKARWLAQIAAWELQLRKNEPRGTELLREIIRRFPQTAQAFAAQRRLFLLDQRHGPGA